MHGNTIARFRNNEKKNKTYSNLVSTSLFKNKNYKIQKYFKEFDRNELMFNNPTLRKIKFSINNDKSITLNGGHSILLDIERKETITIKSNCSWLRPIVFSYKNEYLDVHHS